MSDPIDPVAPSASDRRGPDRRRTDRRGDAGGPAGFAPDAGRRDVVRAAAAPDEHPEQRLEGFAAFAAQLLGQPGQKRGLKGGPEILDKARAAYLGTEWSGPADRRPPRGRVAKTDI